jgi:lysophospholipase L1-like esterase
MFHSFKFASAFVLASALLFSTSSPAAQSDERWASSWFASPQPVWDKDFILPTNVPASLRTQTVREIVRTSIGGKRVRAVLSNRYGKTPLTLGDVRVALAAQGSAIIGHTERQLTFNGRRSVVLAPGAQVVSDPADFAVAPLQRLAVTAFFPEETEVTTFHWGEQQTGYIADGNATMAREMASAKLLKGRIILSGLLVDALPTTRTIVAFGDSITDGNGSTPDHNRRWPDILAERFSLDGIAVVNAGISGARVLSDRMGVNALARFEQDVLSHPGEKTVILLMGINDIGWPGSPFAPKDKPLNAHTLIAGYQQLIAKARTHQVRIVGATLLPFEGALSGTPFEGHFSAEKEKTRAAVNHWIRTAGAFDAVIDFDALLRDPARPSRMLPAFDSGDHLHPGDAGYKAMADSITLEALFRRPERP